ncbi:MAG: hypothetical protein FWE74_04605 [Oscillospiraceae bacterium]|nr:hypothetical protein [Oscillospiraceae bacterium]
MALINCKECSKEISDKAAACPNCGCPAELPEPPTSPIQGPPYYNDKKIRKQQNNNFHNNNGKTCKRCKSWVYKEVKICPVCQKDPNTSIITWGCFIVILIVTIFLLGIFNDVSNNSVPASTSRPATTTPRSTTTTTSPTRNGESL